MNKKNLIIILLSLLLVALAGNFAFLKYQSSSRDGDQQAEERETLNFTLEFLKAISDKWDPAEFESRAHPLLLDALNKSGQSMASDFKVLQKLGKLKSGTCSLSNFATSRGTTDRYAIADYSCKAEYENSSATLLIQIRQDHIKTPWKVTTFKISSPLFGDAPEPAAAAPEKPAKPAKKQ